MKKSRIILISGWGMGEQVWDLFLPYLQGVPVSIVHWRNVENDEDFKRRIVEEARDEEVILVGWSLGALAAINVYHSIQTKGIVLLGGTAKFIIDREYKHGWKSVFVERMKRNLLKQQEIILKKFYASMFSIAEQEAGESHAFQRIADQFQNDSPQSLQCGLQYLIESDVRKQLGKIEAPLLLLHGEEDAICPLSAAQYIQEKTNAQLRVIKQAGHALCFTHPKQCAEEILSFIKESESNDQQSVVTKKI